MRFPTDYMTIILSKKCSLKHHAPAEDRDGGGGPATAGRVGEGLREAAHRRSAAAHMRRDVQSLFPPNW